MAPLLPQPPKWAAVAVVTGVTVLGILTIGSRPDFVAQDPVIAVRSEDAEMNAAIAHARDTLPTFWASYDAPKPSETGHSLKVGLQGDNRIEHIWMDAIKKLPSGSYSGRIANTPRDLPGRREGDLVEFTDADISDWMFMRNDKIVGGETIKPLLKSMPQADADALRARMEQQ